MRRYNRRSLTATALPYAQKRSIVHFHEIISDNPVRVVAAEVVQVSFLLISSMALELAHSHARTALELSRSLNEQVDGLVAHGKEQVGALRCRDREAVLEQESAPSLPSPSLPPLILLQSV